MTRIRTIAATAALLSMAVVFMMKTFADALVLETYGIEFVPHFFVGQAVATIASAALYGVALRSRIGAKLADPFVLGGLLIAAAVAPFTLKLGGGWPFAAALVTATFSSMTAMATWNAATGIVGGREARAFIPRVGAAATVGAVLGGFGSSAVVAAFGVAALSTVAGVVAIAIAALVVVLAQHRSSPPSSPTSIAKIAAQKRRSQPAIRRLIVFMAAAAVVESLLAAMVDLGFKAEVARNYSGDDIGMFFALFYGGVNATLLAVQLRFAPRVLASHSLRVSLAFEPLLLALSGLVWIAAPVLVMAGTTRAAETIGRFGMARPAQEIALTPFPDRARRRWKVMLRGVFAQGGAVAGGLALVAAAPFLESRPAILPAGTTALALIWLALQLGVARRYLDTLGSAIGMLRLSKTDRDALRLDRDGVTEVLELIASDDRTLNSFGRELLTSHVESEHEARALSQHLKHSSPRVRGAVYDILRRSTNPRTLPALRRACLAEPAASGAPEAFDALSAHGDRSAVHKARALTAGKTPEIAVTEGNPMVIRSWSYLAQVGALDEAPDELHAVLRALLPTDGTRAAALFRGALTRSCITDDAVDASVIQAMNSTDLDTRRNALQAAAGLGRSKPRVRMLEMLKHGSGEAEAAVRSMHDAGIRRLALLIGARRPNPIVRARLLIALRSNPNAAAADLASMWLCDDDASVREVAAHTASRHAREHRHSCDPAIVERALAIELDSFALYVNARWSRGVTKSSMVFRGPIDAVLDSTSDIFFVDELERRSERSLSRVCALLALSGNAARVAAAERALLAPTLGNRGKGVDILQEVARGAHRARLFGLLERYLAPPRKRNIRAIDAVCSADSWLHRCATAEVRKLQTRLWALRCTPLFDRMNGEALLAISGKMQDETYTAGAAVRLDAEPALLLVTRGRIEITNRDGTHQRIGAGRSLGELSLIDGQPLTAKLIADSDTTLVRLPRSEFNRARAEHPEIGIGLLLGLARSLRRAAKRPSTTTSTSTVP